MHIYTYTHIHIYRTNDILYFIPVSFCSHSGEYSSSLRLYARTAMGWLWLVGSIKSEVFLATEPYIRDNILQKRPKILSILLAIYDRLLLCHFAFTQELSEQRIFFCPLNRDVFECSATVVYTYTHTYMYTFSTHVHVHIDVHEPVHTHVQRHRQTCA